MFACGVGFLIWGGVGFFILGGVGFLKREGACFCPVAPGVNGAAPGGSSVNDTLDCLFVTA